MEQVILNAVKREAIGSSHAKRLRRADSIPAVLYGAGVKETVALAVELKEFEKVIHAGAGENVVAEVHIKGDQGKKKPTVIFKEVVRDPVTSKVLHIDLQAISLKENVKVHVPLHDTGEAEGLKEGGVVDHIHREVEVECLPTDIPERIDVDISHLKIGDVICVKDIVWPVGVTCTLLPDDALISVLAPRVEEEEVPAAEEEVAAEPEVIGEEKKEEGEEAGAEAGAEAGGEAGGK